MENGLKQLIQLCEQELSSREYAKADVTKKREATEAANKEIVPKEDAQWEGDGRLKDWLKNFNRR